MRFYTTVLLYKTKINFSFFKKKPKPYKVLTYFDNKYFSVSFNFYNVIDVKYDFL